MGVLTGITVKSNVILPRRRGVVAVTQIALLATGSVLCDQATAGQARRSSALFMAWRTYIRDRK